MKKLLISTIAAGLMLSACASNKSAEENQAPQQMSVEEAKQQCQQAGGAGQDSATFDACMKGKGFERVSVPAQAAPAPTQEAVPAPAPAVPAKK
jgi:hypothetical protein